VKVLKSILIVAIISIVVSSCQKAPIACFTIPPGTLHANTSANFDCTCSKNAGWYELYIDGVDQVGGNANGSGSISLTKTGVYPLTFTTTGNHTVKLIVYSSSKKSGKTNETSQTVTVVP
jgi:hypothetical protein